MGKAELTRVNQAPCPRTSLDLQSAPVHLQSAPVHVQSRLQRLLRGSSLLMSSVPQNTLWDVPLRGGL